LLRNGRGWTPTLLVILVAGVLLRLVALGRFPGVYGDEAWYGVNVQALFDHAEPFVRTPSGNFLNVLHTVPLVLFSSLFSPSLAVLRLPSAMWGVLTMVLAFPLLRRPIGERAARWVAMLVASTPILVAYSRFGWDPSDMPFVTLLAVAFALGDRPLWCVVAVLASLLVHPVAIFAIPIYVGAWLPHAHRRFQAADAATRRRAAILSGVGVALCVPIASVVLLRAASNNDTWFPSISIAIGRVTSLESWLRVFGAAVEFVSGGITITYLAGPMHPVVRVAAALICGAALCVPFLFAWKRLRDTRSPAIGMFAGAVVGIAALHVLAGPRVAEPGFERYGIALVVPLLVMSAVAIDAWVEQQAAATWMAGLFMATLFGTTIGSYVVPFMTQGGHAAESGYRTTTVAEPKAAACRFIIDDSRGATSVRVTAADWTLYWTARYLLWTDRRVVVMPAAGVELFGGERPAGAPPPSTQPPDRIYELGWGGGPEAATWRYPAEAPILFVHRRQ